MIYKDNSQYVGKWVNGRREGPSEFVGKEGSRFQYKGNYENGIPTETASKMKLIDISDEWSPPDEEELKELPSNEKWRSECAIEMPRQDEEESDDDEDSEDEDDSDDNDPDDLPPCPGIIGEDNEGPIVCGLEIWESCTDVDEYLKAINGEESEMDSSDDILANPHNYWRIVASATPTASAPIAGGARRRRRKTRRKSKKRRRKSRRKRKKKRKSRRRKR